MNNHPHKQALYKVMHCHEQPVVLRYSRFLQVLFPAVVACYTPVLRRHRQCMLKCTKFGVVFKVCNFRSLQYTRNRNRFVLLVKQSTINSFRSAHTARPSILFRGVELGATSNVRTLSGHFALRGMFGI